MGRDRLIIVSHSRCGSTITRDLLSSHPKIHIANELRIYNFGGDVEDLNCIEDHVSNILRKASDIYHKMGLKKGDTFDCLFFKIMSLIIDKGVYFLDAIEEVLFDESKEIIGDKSYPTGLDRCLNFNKNIRIIHTIRDVRDVVSSGTRAFFSRKGFILV